MAVGEKFVEKGISLLSVFWGQGYVCSKSMQIFSRNLYVFWRLRIFYVDFIDSFDWGVDGLEYEEVFWWVMALKVSI
jgi:hypothetical protein